MPSPFEYELHHTFASLSLRQLDAEGIDRNHLRTPAYARTSYGHYRTSASDRALGPAQRIADAVPLVPAYGAIAGWAAAYVHGVRTFDGLHPHTLARLPIVVALSRNVGRSQHHEVQFSRELLDEADIATVGDIRVTTPERTAFDLTRWAADLTEAVVAVDAFLQYDVIELDQLRRVIAGGRGRKGIPRARAAADLAVRGVLSPWESRLRVFWEVDLGLPRPHVNRRVTDLAGHHLGTPDLLDEEAALAIEFDGADHRDRAQQSADNVREELLEAHNLLVARVDSLMMRKDRQALGERLRRTRSRGLDRRRELDRWRLG